LLQEYPTVKESGYPAFQTGNWYGLAVPSKTPANIVNSLNKSTLTVLRNPAVNKRLVDLGYIVIGDTPGQFMAHIKSEITNLAKILKDVRVE
jgi:tripartite-type tricarboxylate transporter receptor subunit TctC